MKKGHISVIMGIYNCEKTLPDAINSLLSQTYENWILILCDDASTDSTYQVAEVLKNRYPEKIKLIKNPINMGLNYTLNRCLSYAEGEFIARMDGDDVCSPDRFEKQVAILEGRPDIAIVSTDMVFFDEEGVFGKTNVAVSPTKRSFIKAPPFCHAAAMVRKEAYEAVGGYSVSRKLLRVEDYHLWVKMYEKDYIGMNIKEPLYKMRDDRYAQNRRKFKYRLNEAYVMAYAVKRLGLPIYYYLFCIKPIIIGLLPRAIYKKLHRNKISKI